MSPESRLRPPGALLSDRTQRGASVALDLVISCKFPRRHVSETGSRRDSCRRRALSLLVPTRHLQASESDIKCTRVCGSVGFLGFLLHGNLENRILSRPAPTAGTHTRYVYRHQRAGHTRMNCDKGANHPAYVAGASALEAPLFSRVAEHPGVAASVAHLMRI